jgi:hypothetical protein
LVSIQLLTIFQKVRQGRRQVQDGIEFLHSGDLRGGDPGLMSVAAGLRHNDLFFRSDLRSTAADRGARVVAKKQPIRSAPLDAGPEHQWSTQSEVSASVDWLGLLSVMVLPTRGVNNALTLPTDFMASARP